MTWQGVPFPYLSNVSEHISVALSSIPKIAFESPTDLTTPLMTAVAAVIGGCIPAAIAWRTFKLSSAQLQVERQEQQRFLREERIAQNESLEADRQMQLLIAEKNFNMEVLSVNRQAWINNVRDLIAECCVVGTKMFDERYALNNKTEQFNNFMAEYYTPVNLTYKEVFEQFSDELDLARKNYNKTQEQLDFLYSKIRLMLNPEEEESSSIINVLFRLRCRGAELTEQGNTYGAVYGELRGDINELIDLTHTCLKKEWVRVKSGT
ncbi:TPA: hypothetical protein ACOEHG_003890 [Enterobacter ludwigii]